MEAFTVLLRDHQNKRHRKYKLATVLRTRSAHPKPSLIKHSATVAANTRHLQSLLSYGSRAIQWSVHTFPSCHDDRNKANMENTSRCVPLKWRQRKALPWRSWSSLSTSFSLLSGLQISRNKANSKHQVKPPGNLCTITGWLVGNKPKRLQPSHPKCTVWFTIKPAGTACCVRGSVMSFPRERCYNVLERR